MKLGLDELFIVNPGLPPPATSSSSSWFLGADGGVYRVGGVSASQGAGPPRHTSGLGDAEPVPKYFLGDDGILYETR